MPVDEDDAARVLETHAGLEEVVVDLASSVVDVGTRLFELVCDGVIALRLLGRKEDGEGSEECIRRVPNFALAEDSRDVYEDGPVPRPRTLVRPSGDRTLDVVTVPPGLRVILSAPQYEKLILLFRSESSESIAGSSSSSSSGVGWTGLLVGPLDTASTLAREILKMS